MFILLLVVSCAPARVADPSLTTATATTAAEQLQTPTAVAKQVQPTAAINTATPQQAEPTPSATDAFASEQRIAILGDVRTEGLDPPPVFSRIVQALDQLQPGLVLGVGDMINADADPAVMNKQWDHFFEAAQPLLRDRSFRPCMGNHETNDRPTALTIYRERFDLPAGGPQGLEDLAFSFDWGTAHFVCLSSEMPGAAHQLGPMQLQWLERDLASTNQPYVFVYTHDPAFPVGPHQGSSLDVVPQERDELWSIMKRHNVSAFIAGHEHLYNRQVIDGLTQVILGSSGSDIYKGHGGEFYEYGLLDLGAPNARLRVYDDQGVLQDEALFRARNITVQR